MKPFVCNDVLALFPRLILALVFIAHGGQKVMGWWGGFGLEATVQFMQQGLGIPTFLGYLAAYTEFLGGIFLLLGFWSRLSALGIGITMLVAIITAHPNSFFAPEGMEYALSLFFMALMAFLIGPGKISLDYVLFRKCADAACGVK